MIEEDYVSFEVAKLLKEKGFNGECIAYYSIYKDNNASLHRWRNRHTYVNVKNDGYTIVPTLQMATKWLRENFNMNPVPYATSIGWYFEVFDLTQRDITGCALLYQVGIPSKEKTFETSEEACEAGIRYCLENLI